MKNPKSIAATGLLALSLSAALYGCGAPESPTPAPTVPPATATLAPPTETPLPPSPTAPQPTATIAAPVDTPTPESLGPGGMSITGPAADLMAKSSAAMKALTSYHFTIQNTVNRIGGSQAVNGEGDFQAPDKRRITMKITAQGNTEIITIGNDMFFKMPGSQSYTALSGPANPLGSLGAASTTQDTTAIAQASESADIVGDEQVEGADTTHIKFTYDVDKALALGMQNGPATASTPGPVASLGKANGEMWIEKSTGYMRKLTISSAVPDTAAGSGTPAANGTSVVQVVFSKFNEPVNPPIERPANVTSPDGSPLSPDSTPTP